MPSSDKSTKFSGGGTEVSLADLRKSFDVLLDHLTEARGETVLIKTELYWDVPLEQRVNPYDKPTDLTIGRVSDDLVHLQRIAQGTMDPLGYGLVWLAAVLRALGEETIA